jgi:hypothetical protein
MTGRDRIAECVEAAGGLFGGLWETPNGCFAMVTEPTSRSTTLARTDGLSVASVKRALADVRRRFGMDGNS